MLGHHQYHPTHYHSTRIAAIAGVVIVLLWAMCAPRKLSGQGFAGPGRYQIVNTANGRGLVVDRDDQSRVRLVGGDREWFRQGWDITPTGDRRRFFIRSSVNGNALEPFGDRRNAEVRAVEFTGSPRQQWRIETDPSGNTTIVSYFGRPLQVEGERGFYSLRPVAREDRDYRAEHRGHVETIPAGASITVRTNEMIHANARDQRVYTGVVNQDVMDETGRLAVPRGSNVELLVRAEPNGDLVLDMDSIIVNGQRYGMSADAEINAQQREGLGGNKRTGEFVGGGAVIGSILGAIAGGGKGAAIGAASGAAAGAGAQIFTRGRSIHVPPESLITFRLERPLLIGAPDRGFDRDGMHYHPQDRDR